MANVNVAASHVTFTKKKEFQLYSPVNHPAEHVRVVIGDLIIDVGTGNVAIYDTTNKIPLDNLFDPTHASFIDIDANHLWQPSMFLLTNGTSFWCATINTATKKIIVLVNDSTGGSETPMDEAANGTSLIVQLVLAQSIMFVGRKKNF
jgi:hypothetical protein